MNSPIESSVVPTGLRMKGWEIENMARQLVGSGPENQPGEGKTVDVMQNDE